jgi:hypothetical protein
MPICSFGFEQDFSKVVNKTELCGCLTADGRPQTAGGEGSPSAVGGLRSNL